MAKQALTQTKKNIRSGRSKQEIIVPGLVTSRQGQQPLNMKGLLRNNQTFLNLQQDGVDKPRTSNRLVGSRKIGPFKPASRESDRYQADNEASNGSHRFSTDYGHGHQLDNKVKPSTSKKRSLSVDAENPSPKRVRFDKNRNEIRQAQKDRTISKPVICESARPQQGPQNRDGLRKFLDSKYAPKQPDQALLDMLVNQPRTLSLPLISAVMKALQRNTQELAQNLFGTKQQVYCSKDDYPLHDLQMKHPAFYYTVLNVLDAALVDGAQTGWVKFFTDAEDRWALAYAILGEWLTQRVFKDSAFGLNPLGRREIEADVDLKYLHFDSFLRVKKRSMIVQQWTNAENRIAASQALRNASEELADELFVVLAPLTPWFGAQESISRQDAEVCFNLELKNELVKLIKQAAGLNLSMVCAGENGTVFHVAHRMEKGSILAPGSQVECVNLKDLMEQERGDNDILGIQLTCWPRLEAYEPHGKDQEEMAILQEKLIEHKVGRLLERRLTEGKISGTKHYDNAYDHFCWDCAEAEQDGQIWEDLPRSLHVEAIKQRQKQENQIRQYDERERIMKSRRKNDRVKSRKLHDVGPSSNFADEEPELSDSWSSAASSSSESMSDIHDFVDASDPARGPPRGAYVTIYDNLTPHVVYCAWRKPLPELQKAFKTLNGVEMSPRSLDQLNSLSAVVRKARNEIGGIKIGLEDAHLKLWNFYASNNLWIEWVPFLFATGYLLSRDAVTKSISSTIGSLYRLLSGGAPEFLKSLGLMPSKLGDIERFLDTSILEKLEALYDGIEEKAEPFAKAISHILQNIAGAARQVLPMPSSDALLRDIEQALEMATEHVD